MKLTMIFISLLTLLISGCGNATESSPADTSSLEPTLLSKVSPIVHVEADVASSFAYQTQQRVTIDIQLPITLRATQRQLLLFQNKRYDEQIKLNQLTALITSTYIDREGHFNESFTIGKHLQSIWIVIPTLGYEAEIEITQGDDA